MEVSPTATPLNDNHMGEFISHIDTSTHLMVTEKVC